MIVNYLKTIDDTDVYTDNVARYDLVVLYLISGRLLERKELMLWCIQNALYTSTITPHLNRNEELRTRINQQIEKLEGEP